MDLQTLFIIGHLAFSIAIMWATLPPLWACYTDGRMRSFAGSAILVIVLSLIPIYNAYWYLTSDTSYFYHAPYENDAEEDSE